MKILFFITGIGIGGAEKQLYLLIKGLKNKYGEYIEIKLISLIGGVYVNKFKKLDVDITIYSKNNLTMFKIYGYINFFKTNIKKFQPDIVHSFLYHSNIISKLSLFFVKKNFSLINSYRSLTLRYPFIFIMELINIRKIDMFISNSLRAKKDILLYEKFNPKALSKVINNIFEFKKIDLTFVSSLKKKFKDKKIILSVGRFSSEKDYITNIRTCKKLLDYRDDFLFIYLGDGIQLEKIKKQVEKLNITDYTLFLGKSDKVLEYLSISDIFFQTSKYESQSNSILEAISLKVPIVTTDIQEMRDILKYASFLKVGDYSSMAKELDMILRKGYDKKKLDENYIFLKSNFDEKIIIEKYYKEYKKLINI